MVSPSTSKLFDPTSLTMQEVVATYLERFTKEELFVGIPAKVINTDNYETQQVVDVEFVLQDIWTDGREIPLPQLRSIFVKIPHGGGFAVKLPISKGDLVTLHYSHKSIDSFLDGEGQDIKQIIENAPTARDCYATHGFGTRKSNQAPSKDNLVISCPKTTITITPGGEVTISTEGNLSLSTDSDINVQAGGDAVIDVTGTSTITSTAHNVNANVNVDGNLDVTGTITAPTVSGSTSVTAAGLELAGHTHLAGTPPGTTGPNT